MDFFFDFTNDDVEGTLVCVSCENVKVWPENDWFGKVKECPFLDFLTEDNQKWN